MRLYVYSRRVLAASLRRKSTLEETWGHMFDISHVLLTQRIIYLEGGSAEHPEPPALILNGGSTLRVRNIICALKFFSPIVTASNKVRVTRYMMPGRNS